MRVLVACEESQRVTVEFRKLGHQAFSCDIQPCRGGHPEWHILDDALKVINAGDWDLIIAHPPCTYLTIAGAVRLVKHGVIDEERYALLKQAREFFMAIYNSTCKRICIENPRPMKRAELPPWSQIIQPYDFGDNYSKQTCLWLKGLPYLMPNVIERNRRSAAPSWTAAHRSAKIRSKTFPGIAKAMAQQWNY